MKRKIMKAVLAANPDDFLNGNKPGFDGEKNIYTMKEFKIGKNENKVVEVIHTQGSGREWGEGASHGEAVYPVGHILGRAAGCHW